ncbi:MAG: hypothetical protein ABIJ82_01735 [Patescibacteria group bacterium]
MLNNAGIVYSTEAVDKGHEAEDDLYTILKDKFGLQEVTKEDELQKKEFDRIVFRRTAEEEDLNGGGDCVIYNPKTKEWVHIDLTTATNQETLDYKRENERKRGLRLFPMPGRILHLAKLGSERDLKHVAQCLAAVIDLE